MLVHSEYTGNNRKSSINTNNVSLFQDECFSQDFDLTIAPRLLYLMVNNFSLNTDSGKIFVLLLLDLTAVFDAVFDPTNHKIHLDRLENWVGLSGTLLKWFSSYLQGRN